MATTTVRQDKDANARLRYRFDWDDFVTGEGETIASAVVVTPAGITSKATTVTASTVTITVSAGTEGNTYDIISRVFTSGGQSEDKVLQLTITQVPSASHTIVVEDGSMLSNANSFCSVAAANTYHAGHLYASAWLQANDATREKALIMATRLLDENFGWAGIASDDSQALGWPRSGVYDRNGYAIDWNVMPQALLDATAELARLLMAKDRTAETDTIGFKSLRVGSIALEVDRYDRDRDDIIPKHVKRMLAHLGSARGGSVRTLVRA